MAVSFKEFRDRFPDACIRSDLLMVQSQQYVVKVTIETQASGVSTGLSADSNIEVAEDQARQRALQALGLEDSSTLLPESDSLQFLVSTQQAERSADDGEQVADSSTWVPTIIENGQTPKTTVEPITVAAPVALPIPKPDPPSTFGSQSKPQTTSNLSDFADQPTVPETLPLPDSQPDTDAIQSVPVPVSPIPASALPAPINLSDVIAQTDIELRRLGWSVETGREYLEKTYNKRSRHELSEEELIQFLCYLEGLPEAQTLG